MSKNPIRNKKDGYYLSVKVILNRCVFKTDLKFSRDNTFLISADNLFHKVGAATLNARSPFDLTETEAPAIVSDWMT